MAEDQEKQDQEKKEAEERSAPSGAIVYKAIHKEGEDELKRPSSALAWSGFAAGLSMGFSFLVPVLLHAHLPDAEWRPLVSQLGYSVGFLIVVLGRQQLFTENTLTVMLPLMQQRNAKTLTNVARLWTVVLLANVAGAILFALALAKTEVTDPRVFTALSEVAKQAMQDSFGIALIRGIYAGWLIALMVWLLPFAESARVWVIIILTYIVGAGHLTHVVAGSVEASFLAITGAQTWLAFFGGYLIPALIGNIIGGVTLVAALNHAQVVSGDSVDV